jgi:hypothetical protein
MDGVEGSGLDQVGGAGMLPVEIRPHRVSVVTEPLRRTDWRPFYPGGQVIGAPDAEPLLWLIDLRKTESPSFRPADRSARRPEL